ncbi:MAG: YggS family pyridoxal phosphate-dependent enzyme [Alphaproteobacteria bacterium]|nr:YggS family pyridoxal phosphate-dependent enzyme [Alphaproteobacteria bacterium]
MTHSDISGQNDISANLLRVRSRIATAAKDAGRDPAGIVLIAVSKFHGVERVLPALAAGQMDFGENRVQEAAEKWPALRRSAPQCRLHLIGPLQTNKVRQAVALFDAIHTLDREKLARRLAEEIQASGRSPALFVQVNTGREPQKAGAPPDKADAFIKQCRGEFGLNIGGLMCIPPVGQAAAAHFALLADIAARNGLPHLSMGMSEDFENAIWCGATHVRIGSAIFGERA